MGQISGLLEEIQVNLQSTIAGLDRTFGYGPLGLRETGHPYSITGVTSCITGALPFNVTFNPVQYRERIRNRESGR